MNHTRSILSISLASIMLLTLFAVCTTTNVSAHAVKTTGPAVSGWELHSPHGGGITQSGEDLF